MSAILVVNSGRMTACGRVVAVRKAWSSLRVSVACIRDSREELKVSLVRSTPQHLRSAALRVLRLSESPLDGRIDSIRRGAYADVPADSSS